MLETYNTDKARTKIYYVLLPRGLANQATRARYAPTVNWKKAGAGWGWTVNASNVTNAGRTSRWAP